MNRTRPLFSGPDAELADYAECLEELALVDGIDDDDPEPWPPVAPPRAVTGFIVGGPAEGDYVVLSVWSTPAAEMHAVLVIPTAGQAFTDAVRAGAAALPRLLPAWLRRNIVRAVVLTIATYAGTSR